MRRMRAKLQNAEQIGIKNPKIADADESNTVLEGRDAVLSDDQ